MTRNRRPVTIELRAPVTIPAGPPRGNTVATLPYVPGSVLRGALAALWISRHGPPDPGHPRRSEFIEIFEGDTHWPSVYPTPGPGPEPLSVLRCKYRPLEACHDWAVDEASSRAGGSSPSGSHRTCPVCGGPTRYGKGQVDGARTVRRTRTALDSLGIGRTGTAAEAQLHTVEALAAGTVLAGSVTLPADGAADAFCDEVDGTTIRLGRRRSVQGAAVVRIGSALPPETATSRDDGLAVVRFTTDAILVDDAGRPVAQPDARRLGRALGLPLASIERAWVRSGPRGGWHGASGLPKPVETVIVAGSTFLCRPAEAPDAERRLATTLRGAGLRRNEGFGTVEIDPDEWRPLGAAVGGAARDFDRSLDDDGSLHSWHGLAGDEVDWLEQMLSQRLVSLERHPDAPPPDLPPRVDKMPARFRSRVRAVLASRDLDEIRRERDELRRLQLEADP